MEGARTGIGAWARSREGVLSLLVATAVTVAVIDGHGDALRAPFVFVLSLAGAAFGIAVIARMWESASEPETPAFAKRPAAPSASRMLKEDPNAELFFDRGGFLFRRRLFFTATGLAPVQLDAAVVEVLTQLQQSEPVEIAASPARVWWWYRDAFYWENADYSARDVLALVTRRERRHDKALQQAHALLAVDEAGGSRREPIPQDVRRAVFTRDGGRCVVCDADFDLQYDHVIPVALGGATTVANLQLLCSGCNREKSASI